MRQYEGRERRPQDDYGSVHTRAVVKHPGVDWMSAEDSAKRLKSRNQRLVQTAKQIYEQHSDDLKRYRMACKIVEEATEAELEDPSPRLIRAQKIKFKGVPITKKEAKKQALLKISRDL
jgi:hypothetical protein